MIHLDDSYYLSEGLARICYTHPDNPDLCIKVKKPDAAESHQDKETQYYKKLSRKKPSSFEYPFYAFYHGEVETNLGTGSVYDRINDHGTGKTSATLEQVLKSTPPPYSDEAILAELDRLKRQMIKHRVFAGDLRARNLCCQQTGDGGFRLVIVDGLGHRDFIPLAEWFHCVAKSKVERRFETSNLATLAAQREELGIPYNEEAGG